MSKSKSLLAMFALSVLLNGYLLKGFVSGFVANAGAALLGGAAENDRKRTVWSSLRTASRAKRRGTPSDHEDGDSSYARCTNFALYAYTI